MLIHHRRRFALLGIGAALAGALASVWLLGGWPWTVHAKGGAPTIDVNIGTGTDAPGCGSSLSPCRTIKYALETQAQAGDLVYVFPGTYTETLIMQPGVVVWAVGGPGVTFIDGGGVRGPMVDAWGPAITATAELWGFAIHGGRSSTSGGGVLIGGGASPVIRDCVIRDNVASTTGGGIEIEQGSPQITDNAIYSNTADSGGGVSVGRGQSLIRGNAVYSNAAADRGGAFSIFGAGPILENNVIYHNVADLGGGLYMTNEASPTLSNNTIYSNTAGWGGGIYMRSDSAPRITNNVVVSNAEDGIHKTYASPILDYNDVWGNAPADYSGGLSAGPNSISADPRFADASSADLRLGAGSPAIDAGTNSQCPSTDIRGVTRPVDGDVDGTATCDIGAYEYCSCDARQTISCGQTVTGDTTGHIKTHDEYPMCVGWDETGPEDIYAFNLATYNSRITATLSNLSVDLDVFLMNENCGSEWCFSYGDVEATDTHLPPGRYYIAVDGFIGYEGSYTLSLECSEKRVYLPIILKNE